MTKLACQQNQTTLGYSLRQPAHPERTSVATVIATNSTYLSLLTTPSAWRRKLHLFVCRQLTAGALTADSWGFLDSVQMSLVQLFVPTEVAHDTVAELGELGNVQFKDVRCIDSF